MKTNRLVISAVLALVLAFVGIYLASYLSVLSLGLDTRVSGFGTFFDYMRNINHPRVQPYAWRIKAAGVGAFGLMFCGRA